MHRKLMDRRGMVAVVVALATGVLAACGGSEAPTTGGESDGSSAATATDRAFVKDMTPHHKSAVQMAKVARERAEHGEIKTLAGNIITSQEAEIVEMAALGKEVGVKLGGSSSMEMSAGDMKMLETGRSFDRMFIDMMIPHHQGAIKMARTELDKGENAKVRDLAERVIAAQSKEIEDMNEWRTDWYGKASPAGGVPEES